MWCRVPCAQTEMRTFFRHNFTHARYISANQQTIDALKLSDPNLELASLYLDLRPYMNRWASGRPGRQAGSVARGL